MAELSGVSTNMDRCGVPTINIIILKSTKGWSTSDSTHTRASPGQFRSKGKLGGPFRRDAGHTGSDWHTHRVS